MKLQRLTEIMKINGVPVYAHWSLLLIGAFILLGAIERPQETLAAWAAYFGVILIHECGHMLAAQRKGYQVHAIELYPILGFVRFQEPWSRYDHALIAWGGVAAQAVVAGSLVIFVNVLRFTRIHTLKVASMLPWFYHLLIPAV